MNSITSQHMNDQGAIFPDFLQLGLFETHPYRKLGELFCGPGGMALGAKLTGYDHVWAIDSDEDTCRTYRRNIDCGQVLATPVEEVDFHTLSDIDGLCFGFPCNDFSQVGERKGTLGHFGGLYQWAALALSHFQPAFFVAENVDGLRSTNASRDFPKILEAFAKSGEHGYSVFPQTYFLEDFGIPQTRHRIFIVGLRNDLELGAFEHPKPSGHRVSCQAALEEPPIPDWATNHELTDHAAHVTERLSYIKPGENAFTADLPPHLRLNVKGAKISQIYRRLKKDEPSYTVTGSGGGGTHIYHWAENRALTNRERARLQTFPDDFDFIGGRGSVRAQITH